MINKECRRLAEVDFPIAVVSRNSAREKSGPPGYPSRLHIWWAHRPLAACRAMLLALLLPDPCDEHCPQDFKTKARRSLSPLWARIGDSDLHLRQKLLQFIAEASDWHLSSNGQYVQISRELVAAAYPSEPPLVVDPFAGRGSIPLEALRVGCDAFGSDLNPVAGLILKILLEHVPRRGRELAETLDAVGAKIGERAERELKELYPADPDGARPIAYLWARTVRCESPDCGAELPVYKSAWLAKRGATRARYFKEDTNGPCIAMLIESAPKGGPVTFRIATGKGSETPQPGYQKLVGTKAPGNNANAVCPCCGAVIPGNKKNPRIPIQLAAQRGGADVKLDASGKRIGGAYLLAVVTRQTGEQGQGYRLPTDRDYQIVWEATQSLESVLADTPPDAPCPVPNEPLPPPGTLGFRVQRYGMQTWGDLFSARQKIGLVRLLKIVQQESTSTDLASLLAAAFNRVAMSNMSCTRWNAGAEKMQHTFGRQAVPIVWDFAEVVPIVQAPGNWSSGYELISEVLRKWPAGSLCGQAAVADACEPPLARESATVWFTDPPYYDAVPYSDLSDFFYVWFKRALPKHAILRDPFDPMNPLSPKEREIVQDETRMVNGRPKDKSFFEQRMAVAFTQGRLVLREDGIGCVVFAHKTTEGWEALLSGMIQGGWTITGSWPISTEMGTRLRARESAALATSVHLVCRPRPDDAPVGDWRHVLRELPRRVGDWMERLQAEGIRGADLVFACIGPALEIFSRFPRVETPEGEKISLDVYLQKVWEVVGRTALEQVLGTAEARARNGAAGALEEDARLTALFLWTLEATASDGEDVVEGEAEAEDDDEDEELGTQPEKSKGLSLIFDVVRRFAQPLGIRLADWEGRIIKTEKGIVRLIPVLERSEQLFGEAGASLAADRIEEQAQRDPQTQFSFMLDEPSVVPQIKTRVKGRRGTATVSDDSLRSHRGTTTLDRVHAAMLLHASGRSSALRTLVQSEIERGPEFVRLANSLSALYPTGTEEKRLLDAMLLGVGR